MIHELTFRARRELPEALPRTKICPYPPEGEVHHQRRLDLDDVESGAAEEGPECIANDPEV